MSKPSNYASPDDVEAQFRSGLHDGVYRVRKEVPA